MGTFENTDGEVVSFVVYLEFELEMEAGITEIEIDGD